MTNQLLLDWNAAIKW